MEFIANYWIKNKKNISWIAGVLIGFILLLWIVNNNHKERISLLKENHLYTIGTIREFDYDRHSKIYAKFTFIYLDSVYVGSKRITKVQQENSYQLGKKILVIFSPKNPEINYFLPVYVNSEEWKNEGWKVPPASYSTEKAFKYLESNF